MIRLLPPPEMEKRITDLDSARPPKGDDTTAARLAKSWCVREESDTVRGRISQNPRHGLRILIFPGRDM